MISTTLHILTLTASTTTEDGCHMCCGNFLQRIQLDRTFTSFNTRHGEKLTIINKTKYCNEPCESGKYQ